VKVNYWKLESNQALINGCPDKFTMSPFFAKTRKKDAVKNLLGEPGVRPLVEIWTVYGSTYC
jgi:hypothetical protein